jgi:hypothetical protein
MGFEQAAPRNSSSEAYLRTLFNWLEDGPWTLLKNTLDAIP